MGFKLVDKDKGKAWRAFKKRLGLLDSHEVVVGIMAEDGSQSRGGSITHADLAAVHEYGSKDGTIPQRSFLRSTFDENRAKYGRMLDQGAQKVAKGANPIMPLRMIGETARKDVINKIKTRGIAPDISEQTKRAKGSDIPLLDTGQLVRSIKSDVRKDKP